MTPERLKAVFALAGKTQAQVARDIGLSPQNFSNKIKRGSLTIAELQKIAKACGATFIEFIEFPDGTKL